MLVVPAGIQKSESINAVVNVAYVFARGSWNTPLMQLPVAPKVCHRALGDPEMPLVLSWRAMSLGVHMSIVLATVYEINESRHGVQTDKRAPHEKRKSCLWQRQVSCGQAEQMISTDNNSTSLSRVL